MTALLGRHRSRQHSSKSLHADAAHGGNTCVKDSTIRRAPAFAALLWVSIGNTMIVLSEKGCL